MALTVGPRDNDDGYLRGRLTASDVALRGQQISW
jgi:hypothetical protein